jgi:hypothetical protein
MKPDLYSVEPDGTKTDQWIFEELLGADPVDEDYVHNLDMPVLRTDLDDETLDLRADPSPILLEWDEAQHPRDDAGRFAEGGGSTPAGEGHRLITAHVNTVAERLGYDPAHVDVVDIPPRVFAVAGRTLHEGGHYDPSTGRIEINVRTNTTGPAVQGLIAHEMMHAQDDTVSKARLVEHDDMRRMMNEDSSDYERLFTRAGFPKTDKIPVIEHRWPVASAMAKTHPSGDSYLGTWSQNADGKWAFDEQAYKNRAGDMHRDDGFTAYSKLYWNQVKERYTPEYWRAVSETVAEVGAYQDRAPRGPWKEGVPSKSWQAYGRAIKAQYPHAAKQIAPKEMPPQDEPPPEDER